MFEDFSVFVSSREFRAGRLEILMREFFIRNSSKLGNMTIREPFGIATRYLLSLETRTKHRQYQGEGVCERTGDKLIHHMSFSDLILFPAESCRKFQDFPVLLLCFVVGVFQVHAQVLGRFLCFLTLNKSFGGWSPVCSSQQPSLSESWGTLNK